MGVQTPSFLALVMHLASCSKKNFGEAKVMIKYGEKNTILTKYDCI